MKRQETMTSRERLLKAINHQIPDRVPIDLGGNQTGIPPENIVTFYDTAYECGFYD